MNRVLTFLLAALLSSCILQTEQLEGLEGPSGDAGPPGEDGEKGELGPSGDAGTEGEDGEKGEQGDTGLQGDAGSQGEMGDAGPKGDKGDTGSQGNTGPKGDKGDTGNDGVSPWTVAAPDIYYNTGNVGIGTVAPAGRLHVSATGNANAVVVDAATGNVGIGTTGPDKPLHVSSGDSGASAHANATMIVEDGNDCAGITILSPNTACGHIHFGDPELGYSGIIQYHHPSDAMQFYTDYSERVRITSAGNVGIGTTSPQGILHVANGNSGATPWSTNGITIEGSVDPHLNLLSPNNMQAYIYFGDPEASNQGAIKYDHVNDYMAFWAGGTPEKMRIDSNGNVGIGTTSPNYLLHVNGSAGKPGGDSWTDSSDIRLKKNTAPLEGTLGKLLRLRGVTFEWKEPDKHGNLHGRQTGMIAQQVEQVFPEWVGTDPQGYKTLTFRGFEALTVESLRELKTENDRLSRKVAELEKNHAKLGKLEARLATLERLCSSGN